jgi:hypothetical protein
MKINCKQTIVKFPLADRIILALLTAAVFFFISSSVSFAPTRLMSDSELSSVEAQALFQITNVGSANGSANVIKIDLGIDLNMFAYMDAMRMGYYNNDGGTTGWDIENTIYYWGSTDLSTTPLVWKGVFLELGFDNITSTTGGRTLNYIDLGTSSCSGTVTTTLNTMNGMIATSGTGQNGGVLLRQTASGRRTISFSNWMLSFVFSTKYTYHSSSNLKGIFVKIPNYTTN